jgi:hypothetical protein
MLCHILQKSFLALAILPAVAASAFAQAPQSSGCDVPDDMKKEQKLPCLKASSILVEQPTLTMAQLTNGPDFDPAQPDATRFKYFTDADTIRCYFRPHYAFQKVPGDSMKFQCWQMTADGGFFSKKGQTISVNGAKVVISKDKSGEKSASLFASDDAQNQHEIKADRVKIKYLKPPFPNHNPRFNEVFTAVAATRFMWVLGFPADNVYPAGAASCVGCGPDPFGNKLADNKALLKDAPEIFKVVNVERELDLDQIAPEDDETWSWTDAVKFYSDGEWTHQQKVEFDAYRLALGLIHYHNALPQQNRLVCAQWDAGNAKHCAKPLMYVHDMGSTFGKKRSGFDLTGTNPRGIYSAWQPQTVFENADNCELRATLLGDKQVLKEAQDLMIQRVAKLDKETVKAIFRTARFQMTDQGQIKRLKSSGSQNPEEDALEEWTNTFMSRIDEIKNAKNCKAN